MFKQVRNFDPKKAGSKKGWCLQNTRLGYSIPVKYKSAWQAWLHTEQHRGRPPAFVDVPCYFWYKNELNGHIGVHMADGRFWSDGKFYRSLWTYRLTHPAVVYKGWGESINDVRVVREVRLPKKGDAIQLIPKDTRTTYKKGTTTKAGTIKVTDNTYVYLVRGMDTKFPNRVIINSASGGGDGVSLALYYTSGRRIPGWKKI